MRYRKKPVVVEAYQYKGEYLDILLGSNVPKWIEDAFHSDVLELTNLEYDGEPKELYVNTLEGKMLVSIDDFIIQGVNGELYPCKPDIFEKTYEEVKTFTDSYGFEYDIKK